MQSGGPLSHLKSSVGHSPGTVAIVTREEYNIQHVSMALYNQNKKLIFKNVNVLQCFTIVKIGKEEAIWLWSDSVAFNTGFILRCSASIAGGGGGGEFQHR